MVTASEVAAHMQRLFPKIHCGTARFWGVWFGRPYDNCHIVKWVEADGECLIVRFDEDETLCAWRPGDCRIDSRQFIIGSAERVLWQWYCYGDPHTPENLLSWDLNRDGSVVRFLAMPRSESHQTPSVREPAVQFH